MTWPGRLGNDKHTSVFRNNFHAVAVTQKQAMTLYPGEELHA
jgi:hypothetical protein